MLVKSVLFHIWRKPHYSEANSLLITVNKISSLLCFWTQSQNASTRFWFGFALVWICPFLLPFVFSNVCTFLLSSPVNSINDWGTRVFSCQLRKTFGTELWVSAWVLTASRCFQQCQGTRTACNKSTQVKKNTLSLLCLQILDKRLTIHT